MFWSINFNEIRISDKKAIRFLGFITVIMLIWGYGLVLSMTPFIDFTQKFYSQLTEVMFENMIILRGKPVMSFGTHSMSAFFILLFFFLNCVVIKEKKNNIFHYIKLILLFGLEIPLASNTSFLAMGVMLLLIIWVWNTPLVKIFVAFLALIFVYYLYQAGYIGEFLKGLTINAHMHGAQVRYFSGLYDGNFEVVARTGGVGFFRSNSVAFRMIDSGIIYLFTQGNVIAVLAAYGLMYKFMQANVKAKYLKILFGLFFIWEFISATTFISVRMIFAHYLCITIINSVSSHELKEND